MYRLLEGRVKAMSTSLPLVADLSHPAMRERHWHMLMRVRGGGRGVASRRLGCVGMARTRARGRSAP